MTQTSRPKPLAGIRILDLTRLLPGPMATLHLADLGAEIIKIEDPYVGDYARTMGAARVATTQFFLAINRNKQFVTLDLKKDHDVEQFLALLASADALIEGFRPGVMDKLGLGWERLSALFPRLVMCSISGYGQTGPYADRAGHDLNYIGYTGMLEQTVGPDGTPAIPALQVGDLLGGAQSAVIGMLAALIEARATGLGRYVDVSMTDAVFAHNVAGLSTVNALARTPPAGRDLLTGGVPCYNIYRTSDGRHMAVGALEAKFWEALCDALDRPDLKARHWSRGQKPGDADAMAVKAELDGIFASRTLAAWTTLFDGIDCCVTPILRTDEALDHPLFRQRGMVVEQYDEVEGASLFAALPIRFSDDFFSVERGAQPAGADNPEWLTSGPATQS